MLNLRFRPPSSVAATRPSPEVREFLDAVAELLAADVLRAQERPRLRLQYRPITRLRLQCRT